MKVFKRLLLAITIFPTLALAKPMTLEECYHQALQHHETLPLAEQDIVQARSRFTQIIGEVLPSITLSASEFLQERVNTDPTGTSSNFTRFSTPQVSIGLKQPLFHGLSDLYAAKGYRADIRRYEQLKLEAARGLYADVAQVFYTIAGIERAIQTSSRIVGVQRSQLKTLQSWRDLGKIRDSQLALEESELALIEADIAKLKGDRLVAYEALSFLTGLTPQPPIGIGSPLNKRLASLDAYLTKTEQRPDVIAAKEAHSSSQYAVKAYTGALAPKIDLEANYYPYRVGFQKDINWDLGFTMQLPITPVSAIGKLKEAKSLATQNRLKTEQALRSAQTDVRKAYQALRSSLESLRKYQNATTLAQRSYELLANDQGLGLATQIDVLSARRSWFNGLKLRDAAEVQAWQNWITLIISSGMTP